LYIRKAASLVWISGGFISGIWAGILEMWEMFDSWHVKSHKELKESLQNIIKTADEPTLRLALKVISTVSR
jgi:hypothetical protein